MINKLYKIRLDIVNKFPTDRLNFSLSDVNSSVINIEVSNRDKVVDLTNTIVVIGVTDPSNRVGIDVVKVDQAKDGLVSYVIKPEFKNAVGKWQARLMLILGDDKVVTNTFSYEVKPDEFITINEQASIDERFPLLTDMLSRLSEIEATELDRIEAEKQRQTSIGNMRTDVDKLISDASKKINDYKLEIDNYRLAKDTHIDSDLTQYKQAKDLEIANYMQAKEAELDEYKSNKEVAINQDLANYKSVTTTDINNYKNSKDEELDNYKIEKDKSIDSYVTAKNKELDNYKLAKNTEINEFKDLKDTEINAKLEEVDTAEQKRAVAEQQRVTEHADREAFLNSFESQFEQIETKNVEQDTRLNKVEYINKRQDVVLGGLLNEGGDNRLSITGEGNNVKLEHSKDGIIEVEKVVGNTLVNLGVADNFVTAIFTMEGCKFHLVKNGKGYGKMHIPLDKLGLFKSKGKYKVIVNITKNTLTEEDGSQTAFKLFSYNYANTGIESSTDGNYSTTFTCGETGIKECIVTMKDFSLPSYPIDAATMKIESSYYATSGELEGYIIICEYEENQTYTIQPFEGMQSTFEDKLVTQEMVDAGEELAENLGKYKVGVTVRGKNLYSQEFIDALCDLNNWVGTKAYRFNFKAFEILSVKPNTKYRTTIPELKVPAKFYPILMFGYSFDYSRNGSQIVPTGAYENNTDVEKTISARTVVTDTDNEIDSIRAYVNSWDEGNMEKLRKVLENNLQLEEGKVATPYEPYKEFSQTLYLDKPLYASNELCVHDGKLGVLHNSTDEIDYNNLKYNTTYEGFKIYECLLPKLSTNLVTSKINIITHVFKCKSYDDRFKNMSELECYLNNNKKMFIISNKELNELKEIVKNSKFIYPLAEPVFVPILENTPQWILDSYNSCTVHFETNVPISSSSFTYTGSVPSVMVMNKDISDIQDLNVDMVATTWDMDYRLLEVEWTLEDLTGVQVINLNNIKGGKTMALTRYEQAKIMILGGACDKETLTRQLTRYLEKKIITQTEYDELISLMEAKELVVGE